MTSQLLIFRSTCTTQFHGNLTGDIVLNFPSQIPVDLCCTCWQKKKNFLSVIRLCQMSNKKRRFFLFIDTTNHVQVHGNLVGNCKSQHLKSNSYGLVHDMCWRCLRKNKMVLFETWPWESSLTIFLIVSTDLPTGDPSSVSHPAPQTFIILQTTAANATRCFLLNTAGGISLTNWTFQVHRVDDILFSCKTKW